MIRTALFALAAILPVAATAQTSTPSRIRSVEIKKGEPCPKATSADEVVVCRTIEEPYRIPSGLRDEGAAQEPTNQSWVNRAATVDQVSKVAGGLPDTCSPVGSGGQTGCALQQNRAYAADKRARRAADGSGSQPQ